MTEDRDRDEMQRLLAYANFSKVAEAIGVKRAAVANWAAGRHVTPARLEQVRALYGLPVASQDTTGKDPRPDWAEGLAKMAAEEAVRLIVAPEMVRAMQILAERAEATPPPSGVAAPEGTSPQDPAEPDPAAQ